MPFITVQVSEQDLVDVLAHFARPDADRIGKPLVAVCALADIPESVPQTRLSAEDCAEALENL